MRVRSTNFWVALFCTSLLTANASAQTAAAPAASNAPLAESLSGMAKAEYEAGKILYADGDFAGAALKFRAAYEISKDPRLLWNTAAAEKNLRHYARVEALVKQYVAESPALSAEDKADAQALLDTVRAFIADVTINVNEAGADVFVDDERVGASPLAGPLRIEMGARRVRVSKAGFRDFASNVNVPGGGAITVDAKLQSDVHEGRLRVVSPGATITVDGKVMGVGQWEGPLSSGAHGVNLSAKGKRSYQTDTVVQDNQTTNLQITLEAESASGALAPKGSSTTWIWITAGAVVVAGGAVGAYFLLKPDDKTTTGKPVDGSLGTVELPMRF
jgi:hypothetical protein